MTIVVATKVENISVPRILYVYCTVYCCVQVPFKESLLHLMFCSYRSNVCMHTFTVVLVKFCFIGFGGLDCYSQAPLFYITLQLMYRVHTYSYQSIIVSFVQAVSYTEKVNRCQ